MATPKVIPTIDDSPKEPRIKPKRCPSCQRPNKPEAVKCGVCGYNLDGPPPRAGASAAKPKAAGGGATRILMAIPILALLGGAGAVAYYGVNTSIAYVQSFYKEAPPAPTPQQTAQASARQARLKVIDSLKTDAGNCFTQFNDLMDKSKRSRNPNAQLQAFQNNTRTLASATSAAAACTGDMSTADKLKLELCDTAAQLKTCLNTVMNMQRELLGVKQ